MDTRRRSWAKAVTWRASGVLLLGIIAYWITGSWVDMGIITVLFTAIRLILYYLHERVWERVGWGKVLHPLAELPVRHKLTAEDMEVIREKLGELGYL